MIEIKNLTPVLLAAIATATLLNVLLKRLNMPTVIGYIFTGVLIGNALDIQMQGNEPLENIAELGVVFLMFTIGLEFSVSHLNSMKREVFLFGLLQVVVTSAVVTVVAQTFFGLAFKTAIIVGAGLALSSTAIVLKLLTESGKIKSDFGRSSVGILIFQDIAVIPILLIITIFTSHDKSLSALLLETAIRALIALGVLVLIGKYLLGHLFRAVANTNSKEIYMGLILLIVVGSSYIANHFGFSYSLGGFIAGMLIADTIYKYQVEADLIPFRDLLLGVFFVTVGLQIHIGVVMDNILSVVLLCSLVMVIKAIVTFAILYWASGAKDALKAAISLAQIGEFSLVVFSLLLGNKLLDATSVEILMVATVLSMILTPLLINNLDRIVGLIIKEGIDETSLEYAGTIGGHVILCGYGSFGRTLSQMLDRSEINHVVVTNNTEDYVRAREANKTVVFGDPANSALLNSLHIGDAMNTILALDDFAQVQRASAAINLIDPEIRVIAKVQTEEERLQLEQFNHELLLDGNTHAASLLVGQLDKSRLLARETSSLRFLGNYRLDEPIEAITKVEQEQARLLEIMTASFDGLREAREIMQLKALHDSFKVLSEIIEDAIHAIMRQAQLPPQQYERINILLDNQHQLMALNDALERLGRELKDLATHERTRQFSQAAVEGLDTILMTLIDLAKGYSEDDMVLFRNMTSGDDRGLAGIREKYLGAETNLDAEIKTLLFSSTNHMDRLKSLFRLVGENYRRLAIASL